jgi:hypothetical protein
MTELEKYQLINTTDSVKELQDVILKIADKGGKIEGRSKIWDAKQQSEDVEHVVRGSKPPNRLTRSYGIRQQAIYLLYYRD